MLMQQLKADQLQARKNGNKAEATLLTTLIGEAATIGKNDGNRETNDQEVIQVIKKFIKGVDDTLTILYAQRSYDSAETMEQEKKILSAYLPKQMNGQEIMDALAASGLQLNKGTCMKYLKDNFAGKFDGKLASQIIDELLKQQ
jgi:uncharacterized protein YqeY